MKTKNHHVKSRRLQRLLPRWLLTFVLFSTALLASGCSHNPPTPSERSNSRIAGKAPASGIRKHTKPAAPVVAAQQQNSVQPPPNYWNHWQWQHIDGRYTASAHQAIRNHGMNLLNANPSDVLDYCPAYPKLNGYERLQFWGNLLEAMSKLESNHNTYATHQENFRDRHGEFVVSRGLLQISQESANGYRCGIRDATQLHNPTENIHCAVRIMSRWVERDKRIGGRVAADVKRPWRGGARYWSVLRSNSRTALIQSNLRASPLCNGALPRA